ncbi:type VI secretion system contractile sheath large subunit [Acinetobacter terrestris]|uniref:type VI secretion system contractile sheath large subunit n=1 Tax=Acinetobacter terrestris TaxID=2529843 RepID=UPI001038FE23|nr:type VI secretion system contractile sheath large subunit [Acinetobacter terrestris]NNH35947.1 type VI secretion system contractile sheath large subunit [Acinetobacter terrestris]TCB48331.1 type VI secretion system contractile sheath large subunit [Acinetobacter terrestris]
MNNSQTAHVTNTDVEEFTLLDSIVEQSRIARNDEEHDRAKRLIGELVKEVMAGTIIVSENMTLSLDKRIAEIDDLISNQLSKIIHHEQFQKIESTWRGLYYFCQETPSHSLIKIRMLNTTKKELTKDFQGATDFDQSTLFKKIYEEEYGSFGGAPYATLIGDFEFDRTPSDMYLLAQISHVAAAAHAPFISAASPNILGLESFTDIDRPRDVSKIFETAEYVQWRSFRESDDARYVALTMPRVLGRLPYHPKEGTVTEGFNFVEEVSGQNHDEYLWMNAAYAFATRLTNAFDMHGWCAAIRGVEGGGLVEGLPVHTFKTNDGEVIFKCPTEIAITDRREKELSDLGFIPLVHCKNTDYAAFFGAQSTQKPKKYDSDTANANSALSSQIQYIMAVSRIAHYLKAMMRDKVGSFASAGNVEAFLNEWLSQYVLLDDGASQEAKAQYPLREASVKVVENPAQPGHYKSVVFLRPHFQLDELSVSLRLVTELPQSSH